MANKTVIAGSDITAPQMSEFWSQVASGKINRINFQSFLERKKNLPLLEYVETIEVEGCDEFHFDKEFRSDRNDVKLYLGNLPKIFGGMKEQNIPSAKLRIDRLTRSSRDKTNENGSPGILNELGEDCAEISLCHMLSVLKKKREDRFIFYIRDKNRNLWAVSADWGGGGWRLGACSVEDRGEWGAGHLVVSCEDSKKLSASST